MNGATPHIEMLNSAFAALADPTRRAILERLADGEASVGELSEPFDISGPAISRHLRVLEDAGLVNRRVERQRRIIRLNPKPLEEAAAWVEKYRSFWGERLDALDAFLEAQPKKKR